MSTPEFGHKETAENNSMSFTTVVKNSDVLYHTDNHLNKALPRIERA